MRILFISQWFAPESSLQVALANGLAKLGHELEVLTGFPNYPGGKLYPGYRIRPWQRECLDGLNVIRVPLYPSHDRSSIRRVINYASFALSSATIGLLLARRPDVVYVYHPPATVALAPILLRSLRRIPFVYHVQDMWPDTLVATGMFNSRVGLAIIDRWCRLIYRMAGEIVVISPGFQKLLLQRGVPEHKMQVVHNCCDENQIRTFGYDAALAQELCLAGRFNIVFAGNIGKAQALGSVLHAAKVLQSRIRDVQFVLMGNGVETDSLSKTAFEEGIGNVRFIPMQPQERAARIIACCDAGLVHLKDDPLFRITIPGKIQAYMAVGKPILMGVRGDAANLIEEAECGVCCIPEDTNSIVDAVHRMHSMPKSGLESMGEKGRMFYHSKLSVAASARKFDEIFRRIVANRN